MNSPHNNPAAECPPPELLQRVARGVECSAADEAAVEKHLDQCEACRELFDGYLATPEELAELRSAATGNSESDLEAIKAAGAFPRLAPTQLLADQVMLSCGLKLGPPRDRRFLGRLGAYDILAVLGEGGMGLVLKAYEESLQRELALKVVSSRLANDPVARSRFVQEAQCAARLVHPNIITIHAVSQDEPPMIVMEFVPGKSLAVVIAEEGRLPPLRAAATIRQVLEALEHAHAAGIVHRDVKPANILFAGREQVKLVDFGLARGVADAVRHTMDGTLVGTAWYMSPEQASGASVDPRSDLFSLGVVLFELLTGVVPFSGPDVYKVLERIRTESAPDVRQLNPLVPASLAEIVARALERDRDRRYASAREFAAAVDDFLAMGNAETQPLVSPPTGVGNQAEPLPRCAACSQTVVSKLSLVGVCETCGQPICQRCWHILRVRRCKDHAEQLSAAGVPLSGGVSPQTRSARVSDPAETPDRRSPPAPSSNTSGVGVPGEVKLPKIKSPERTPLAPRVSAPPQPPQPSPEEQLRGRRVQLAERVAEARKAGRPVITGPEAMLAEETFLRLVENSLWPLSEVRDPYHDLAIPVKSWSRAVERITPAPFPALADAWPIEECPYGAAAQYDLRKRGPLGGLQARVVIEARSMARIDRFARQGYDDEPVSRMELESLLNNAAGRAAASDAWHLLILFSPTGWTAEARDFACGKGTRPFHDRLTSVALFDNDAAPLLWNETDEKLVSFRDAFAGEMDESTLDQVRRFLSEYFELNNSISLETLAQEVGISRKAAQRAMRLLALTGPYAVAVLHDVGIVLTRK